MVKKRYGLVFALTLAFLLTTVGSTVAVESGRYQAMQISVGKKSEYDIFILDTKEGHMWLLETRESRIDGKRFKPVAAPIWCNACSVILLCKTLRAVPALRSAKWKKRG